MAKKVAVLVVNPVNGSGLFQYLETFFENGIPFRTFAVADTTNVKTNSGLRLQTDDIIASLKGHEQQQPTHGGMDDEARNQMAVDQRLEL